MEGAIQSERWERVQELFHAACERTPRERSEYLDGACGTDPALRAEVEALLATHDSTSDGLLDAPLVDVAVKSRLAAPPLTLVGRRIGHYLVHSVIASGGMGTVYSAEQDSPHRTVALKVMRQSALSRSALRRFHDEAEILARLRHPNIAQVYEAGVHDDGAGGLPYFVMEFIPDARTITEYARDRGLDTRARLALFAKVCDAVHHGHQKGIIHRDLKPGNILVEAPPLGTDDGAGDGDGGGERRDPGEPKVIDFGVARSTDADVTVTTQRTDMGQLIGTMQYMSPEQCDGDAREIDTRSDVYALGVVLYELLSEQLPYNAGSTTIVQAVMTIRETTPPPLSTLRRELRGDIETIVSKAMAKDRAKRYQSAAELAADIRRHLRGEPIEARRPGRWAKAVRWVARRPLRSAAALAMVIVGSSVGLSYGTVWWLNQRPHHVEPTESGDAYIVRSATGRELHRLHSPPLRFAAKANRLSHVSAGNSGGRGALVALSCDARLPFPDSVALLLFDLHGDWSAPRRIRGVHDDEVPESPLLPQRPFERRGDLFDVRVVKAIDVFPEHPGQELIVAHLHANEPVCVLRIYDLDLNILYEAWHYGHFTASIVWDARSGLLLLPGLNAECVAVERGIDVTTSIHPQVGMALRPALGQPRGQWIRTTDVNGTIEPAWYVTLHPVGEQLKHAASIHFVPTLLVDPPDAVARIHVAFEKSWSPDARFDHRGSFVWPLNARGEIIGPPELANLLMSNMASGVVPPMETWSLGPLPPITNWLPHRPGVRNSGDAPPGETGSTDSR